MNATCKSFFGDPSYKPKDKQVARLLESIRLITDKQTDAKALQTATSAMSALIAFVAERFGLQEAMAIVDQLRDEITGG